MYIVSEYDYRRYIAGFQAYYACFYYHKPHNTLWCGVCYLQRYM
jgi:hypothetical protein